MKDKSVPPTLSFQCPVRWESMRADGPQRRFCDQCQLHVHDLSAMSRAEAARFVTKADGRACMSYLVRPDGSMVSRPRWSALARPWAVAKRCALWLLAALVPVWFSSCARNQECQRTGGVVVANGDNLRTSGK